jgi:hypothetical protein
MALGLGWRQLQRTRDAYLAMALCVFALALAPVSYATFVLLLGINYGRVGEQPPAPQAALPLLHNLGIGSIGSRAVGSSCSST